MNLTKTKDSEWIPIAPDSEEMTSTFKCPACESFVYIQYPAKCCNYEYCPHCGQRINK